MLDEQKRRFLAGEKIQPEHFLELTKRDGFEIHIRTKGTFAKSVRMLDKNGTIHYVKAKGQRKPDFTGCQKAIKEYLRLLLSERIEQRLMECDVSSDLWKLVSDSHKMCHNNRNATKQVGLSGTSLLGRFRPPPPLGIPLQKERGIVCMAPSTFAFLVRSCSFVCKNSDIRNCVI